MGIQSATFVLPSPLILRLASCRPLNMVLGILFVFPAPCELLLLVRIHLYWLTVCIIESVYSFWVLLIMSILMVARCRDVPNMKRHWVTYPSTWRVSCKSDHAISCSLDPAVKELRDTGEFQDMDIQTDEDEHSIEMHLPYVRKVFEG